MQLSPKEKVRRVIDSGGVAAATFWRGELQSLVRVWRHENKIIVTWEEAPAGAQYDEHRYTRDDRQVFDSIDSALAFLEQQVVAFSEFEGTIKRKLKNG